MDIQKVRKQNMINIELVKKNLGMLISASVPAYQINWKKASI